MNEQDLDNITHDVEQVLLGSLLIDRDVMALVSGIVIPEAFRWDSHRVLYSAMLSLWKRREPCDSITAIAEVRAMGYGSERFPADYIAGLMLAVPHAVHAGYYAAQIMQFAKRRAIIDAGGELVKAAYGDTDQIDTGELIAGVRNRVDRFELATDNRTVSLDSYVDASAERAVDRWQGLVIDETIPTGIKQLDRILTGGLRPGQLVLIGARPGMGKTSLMIRLALRNRTHLVSLEMSQDEILHRIVAVCGDVPYSVAYDMVGDLALRERWLDGCDKAKLLPITLTDHSQTTMQIESELSRLVAEKQTQVVVIDHLDWLADKIRSDSPEQRTAELVHRCKAMAKACGVPVVLLAQLNRGVEKRPGFMPHLSDFRNSGAIEQDADVAILLYRRRYYSERGQLVADESDYVRPGSPLERVEMIVAKNRNGMVGSIPVGWSPKTMSFHDLAGVG